MIIGTTIAPGQTTRTLPFPRQGDNAVFRYQGCGGQGAIGETAEVYSKNEEDTSWTDHNASFSSGTATVTGLREMVVLEFAMATEDITVVDPLPFEVSASNVRIRVLPPVWYDDPLPTV